MVAITFKYQNTKLISRMISESASSDNKVGCWREKENLKMEEKRKKDKRLQNYDFLMFVNIMLILFILFKLLFVFIGHRSELVSSYFFKLRNLVFLDYEMGL